ncbi:hypothetical protein AJ78_02180 [Emergomyces pasteurianus Ep9510]|uniref:Ribosomal RNA-processing protein 17 n=1 Tax=Emergomyces pasteurianus Ep9510 TaxID=1447872 RepID=A0A1J9QBZ7_9EURO|nr:hypothetical protein AJ78_02180 [Emergomyces pasteurianus Ep9510]
MAPYPKKRKLTTSNPNAVQEILFDPSARAEYLTGFHKRKLQRAKHAQEIAEKKAREEKKEQRRRIREERRAEFERAIAENRTVMQEISRAAACGSGSDGEDDDEEQENNNMDEEWEGITEPPPIDYEAEYIDEDKYTTVTVEELDASREGFRRRADKELDKGDDEENDDDGKTKKTTEESEEGQEDSSKAKKRVWVKTSPKYKNKHNDNADRPKSNTKRKKKSFRYENKSERKVTKFKERAGGKKRARERKAA